MEEQKPIDWRDDVSDTSKETLKVLDGEAYDVTFLNEGEKRSHIDYGDSIVFSVKFGEEEKNFFVKHNNYSLLKQIKELGEITGKEVRISRKGSKRSDTRYTIEPIEKKEEITDSKES